MLPLDRVTCLSFLWSFCIAALANSFSIQIFVPLPPLQLLWVELIRLEVVATVDTVNFLLLGFTKKANCITNEVAVLVPCL